MLTLATGKKIVPTRRSTEFRVYSEQVIHRLSTDLFFWNQFQVHWLHALHAHRLGPDLGGTALEGYAPCTRRQAAGNLIRYADFRHLLLDTVTRTRLPLTEGLIKFIGNPLRILPDGRPGLWIGTEFYDLPALCWLHDITPKEARDLLITSIEDQ